MLEKSLYGIGAGLIGLAMLLAFESLTTHELGNSPRFDVQAAGAVSETTDVRVAAAMSNRKPGSFPGPRVFSNVEPEASSESVDESPDDLRIEDDAEYTMQSAELGESDPYLDARFFFEEDIIQ